MPKTALARTTTALAVRPAHAPPNMSGARSDGQLVALWLKNKGSANTRAAYAADVALFQQHTPKALHAVTLADLVDFKESLEGAPSTRARRIGAVKSLLSFGHTTGYLLFNVGKAVQPVKVPDALAKRILPAEDIHRLIAGALDGRDATLLRLLYVSGVRVAEVCSLTWADLVERGDAGTLTCTGKGEKTRTVLLSAKAWAALLELRGDAEDGAPVFASRTGRHLDRSAVLRIVRKATKAAKIKKPVSPHWFRHAHASHSLDRGAPVQLLAATLGHASLATTSRYAHAKPNDSSGRYLDA